VFARVKTLFFKGLFGTFDFFVGQTLRRRPDWKIQSGPFQGMRWGAVGIGSSITPKLLGVYERELHGHIEQLPVFDLVIDIGAAEGWYAVGLLYRGQARKMIAYEMTEAGRTQLLANVQRNALPPASLEIKGECSVAGLQSLLKSLPTASPFRLLIISDCEGFESQLLGSETLRLCPQAHFLIETHDQFVPGVHQQIADRLAATHRVSEMYPARRNASDLPPSAPWLFKLPIISRLMLSERRCQNLAWLCAVPKSAAD
jgi:hypothetical protein